MITNDRPCTRFLYVSHLNSIPLVGWKKDTSPFFNIFQPFIFLAVVADKPKTITPRVLKKHILSLEKLYFVVYFKSTPQPDRKWTTMQIPTCSFFCKNLAGFSEIKTGLKNILTTPFLYSSKNNPGQLSISIS